jgi:hypothetical protein
MKKDVKTRSLRPLSDRFTETTLRRAISAKHRSDRITTLRELLSMKLVKKPVGAVIALALVVTSGVGVYAASNWFNGRVEVASDDSIMTVDLSQCNNASLPPGVEPSTDKKAVKFKIVGQPHIQPQELQRKLLVACEFQNVLKLTQAKSQGMQGTVSGVLGNIDYQQELVTLRFNWGGKEFFKTFALARDALLIDKGESVNLKAFTPGSFVVVTYDLDAVTENQNPLDTVMELKSLFKTQYDTREYHNDGKSLYDTGKIMPLDYYKQLHK